MWKLWQQIIYMIVGIVAIVFSYASIPSGSTRVISLLMSGAIVAIGVWGIAAHLLKDGKTEYIKKLKG